MNKKTIEEHGLTNEEYQHIIDILGREPNLVELGIFSVMWSEHCCYKSSKIYLKQFPTEGPNVLQGPGENAGIIDIGDDLAIAFKIESHNHPSFIEPYQGAATGVGGILRDIFTMGARPIASLNSLHFGAVDHPRTPYLVRGVVAGIGGYGNPMGIPMVGGETCFEECYNGNNLVNAFTLGIVPKNKIFLGIAKGVGNSVILVGSKTGRDGIHGATMASDVFDEDSESKRPTVQVGDPFTEKKLMEACLEAFELEGAIVGIQDMGAAGFTCSSFEMSEKGKVGMEIWLDKIPQREEKMTPYEIMLSESQERMLLIAEEGRVEELRKIFEKWELEFAVVGKVLEENKVRGYFNKKLVFELPVAPITDEAPLYERPTKPMETPKEVSAFIKNDEIQNYNEVLQDLLGSPNICQKEWVWRQYDTMVGTNTVVTPGADAAVVRIKENGRLLGMTVDSKAKWCYADPYWGAVHTVAEAARNLAVVGAKPLGITDCLNFGNPENPEVMWQFKEVCRGISDACRAFETPVTGGNVSLYNETEAKNIYPTPAAAMAALFEKNQSPLTPYWKKEGDQIYSVGGLPSSLEIEPLDFKKELAKQRLCIEAAQQQILASAHDISRGGLAVALALCSFSPAGVSLGIEIELEAGGDTESLLFGEVPAPILVSLSPNQEKAFLDLANRCSCPVKLIGNVGGPKMKINHWIDSEIKTLYGIWAQGFETIMNETSIE